MLRLNPGEIFELVTAAGAGRDHDRVRSACAHLLDQRRSNLERQIVFRLEHAERARHPAAPAIKQSGSPAGQSLCQTDHEPRMQKRFRVAMCVNRNFRIAPLELQRRGFTLQQIVDKFFKQKTTFSHCLCVWLLQFAVILDEH